MNIDNITTVATNGVGRNHGSDDSLVPSLVDIERMHELASGQAMSAVVFAVVRLGVVDQLVNGPKTNQQLAALVGAHEDSLYRLMRAAASLGIFHEEQTSFSLTKFGATLRADSPKSLRPFVLMTGDDWHRQTWSRLDGAVRSGQPSFVEIHGKDFFSFLRERTEVWANFNETMTSLSTIVNEAVPDSYDFSRFRKIVDVGGGHGSLLAAILSKSPSSVRGLLFDLPEVVRGADAHMRAAGVGDRCEIVGGNFDDGLPVGGDAYIIKRFLHGFDDARSIATLEKIRNVMAPGGRVFVIEMLVRESSQYFRGKLDDLEMLTLTRWGRERTLEEFRRLFAQAGFSLSHSVSLPLDMCLIEGTRAA